jgi:hypothetical protein
MSFHDRFNNFELIMPFFINQNIDESTSYKIQVIFTLQKYFMYELLELELTSKNLEENEIKIVNIVKEYHNFINANKKFLINYLQRNYSEIIKNDFYIKILKDNFIFKINDLDVTNMPDQWLAINNILFNNVFKNNYLFKNEYNTIKSEEELTKIKNDLYKVDVKLNIKNDKYKDIINEGKYIRIIKNLNNSKYISDNIKNIIQTLLSNLDLSTDRIKKELLIMKKFLESHIKTDETDETIDLNEMMHLIQKEKNRLEKIKNTKYKLDKILLIPVKKNSLV